MRSLTFLFLSIAVGLGATEHTARLAPQTIADWSVSGANSLDMSAQSVVALPAGSQIARTFAGSNLVAVLTTQPVFGATPEDCPILEIGSSALVFARIGETGALLLVERDQSPVTVSSAIALTADGRSAEPVKVTVDAAGNEITVACAGKVQALTLGRTAFTQTAIVLSAGANVAWPVDFLEITTFQADEVSIPGPKSGADSTASLTSGPGAGLPGDSLAALGLAATSKGADITHDIAMVKPAPVVAESIGLEVFTPPAVRLGRADQVRAAVKQAASK